MNCVSFYFICLFLENVIFIFGKDQRKGYYFYLLVMFIVFDVKEFWYLRFQVCMVILKYYIYFMEIQYIEINRGNKVIIVDGYVYCKINVFKNGNVVYMCSVFKNCKKMVIIDEEGDFIVKVRNQYSCKIEFSFKKVEVR